MVNKVVRGRQTANETNKLANEFDYCFTYFKSHFW